MKKILKISLLSIPCLAIMAFTNVSPSTTTGEVIDIDGNSYKTVNIGEQEWIAENLSVSHFRNGDEIHQAKTEEEWMQAIENKEPAWMYLNFTDQNSSYPKLYNWYALHDNRGIAPDGWRVCTEEDVKILVNEIDSTNTAGKKLKSSTGWKDENNGFDEFGFNGAPTGSYNPFGNSDSDAQNASWWTSTVKNQGTNYEETLSIGFYLVYFSDEFGWETPDASEGRAIRCIKE